MMQIQVGINNSPLQGKEGTKFTISQIKERLLKEAENDVALKVVLQDGKGEGGFVTIKGRGDLHLAVLIERMRREGFEMSITPPEIVTRKDASGATMEPIERVIIELAPQFTNGIIEKLGLRKGIYEECVDLGKEKQRLVFTCPTRGLVGLRSELLNDTKGTGVMQSSFIGF